MFTITQGGLHIAPWTAEDDGSECRAKMAMGPSSSDAVLSVLPPTSGPISLQHFLTSQLSLVLDCPPWAPVSESYLHADLQLCLLLLLEALLTHSLSLNISAS